MEFGRERLSDADHDHEFTDLIEPAPPLSQIEKVLQKAAPRRTKIHVRDALVIACACGRRITIAKARDLYGKDLIAEWKWRIDPDAE